MPAWLRRIAPILLTLWVAAVVTGVGSLMGGHLLTLPMPKIDDSVLLSAFAPRLEKNWLAAHALSLDCGCSRRILDHLLARGAHSGLDEKVLLLAGTKAMADQLASRGYAVELLDEAQLRKNYQIEAVPLLVIRDPEGRVRYLGGYSERKRGEIEDVAILTRLMGGEQELARPAFGCAVGQALRDKVDPLGLRN